MGGLSLFGASNSHTYVFQAKGLGVLLTDSKPAKSYHLAYSIANAPSETTRTRCKWLCARLVTVEPP